MIMLWQWPSGRVIRLRIITGSDMRKIDLWAQKEKRIPPLLLMENAGRAVALAVENVIGAEPKQSLLFLIGKGNNGGDALVAARHLYQQGMEINLFFLFPPEEWPGLVRKNWELLKDQGIKGHYLADEHSFYLLKLCLSNSTLVIDGILGTGLRASLPENIVKTIKLVNHASIPVLAIDVPTGVDADQGYVAKPCVQANYTVTFAWAKRGQLLYPAKKNIGKLFIADISIPESGLELVDIKQYYFERQMAQKCLPLRDETGHKNTFGHVLVLAGSQGMMGAAYLASKAVLRSGAGLVTVGVPQSQAPFFNLALPEAITLALPETEKGTLAAEAWPIIKANLAGKKALVFGPGLKTEKGIKELLTKILQFKMPLVLDADGLNVLAQEPELLAQKKAPLILTPHPGEMARLLKITTEQVLKNPVDVALQAANTFQAITVLKGVVTIITTLEQEVYINSTGSSALATAGTGDVLAGLIAGLLAQGLSTKKAALLGVYLHGLAGEIVAAEKGERGVIAGDVVEAVPLALKDL